MPALIIIDMQEDFVLPHGSLCIQGAKDTLPRIREVLDGFRQRALPIFHVVRSYRADGVDVEWPREQAFRKGHHAVVPGTPGARIVSELAPRPNEYVVTKKRFSAFMHTELDLLLRRLHIRELAVCGTQLPVCVRCSVFDAIALDYRVTLIADGTSAQTEAIAEANRFDMANIGTRCLNAADYLSQLAGA